MASFINAQRWATGVKTHKTIRGDFVVCTGSECLGCFPEDNPNEAEELGVCDVNAKDYPFRTFLNDDYFESRLQKALESGKQTNFVHEITMKTKPTGVDFQNKEKVSCSGDSQDTTTTECEEGKRKDAKRVSFLDNPVTAEEENVTDSSVIVTKENTDDEQNVDDVDGDRGEGNIEKNIYETLEALGIKITEERKDFETKDANPNEIDNIVLERAVPEQSKSERRGRRLPAKRCIIGDDLYEEMTGASAKAFLKNMGDDCRCIFFAIEYYGQSRKLPLLRVTEIVDELGKVIEVADIKCVQRFYNTWHIVVRSPAAARVLVTRGVIIRGRHYTLVQDSDSYLDIIRI